MMKALKKKLCHRQNGRRKKINPSLVVMTTNAKAKANANANTNTNTNTKANTKVITKAKASCDSKTGSKPTRNAAPCRCDHCPEKEQALRNCSSSSSFSGNFECGETDHRHQQQQQQKQKQKQYESLPKIRSSSSTSSICGGRNNVNININSKDHNCNHSDVAAAALNAHSPRSSLDSVSHSTATTSRCSSGACSSRSRSKKKNVRFGSVEIRRYERIAGDNPSCSSGPPIGIGWKHGAISSTTIDDYEDTRRGDRKKKRGLDMVLSRIERESLLRDWDIDEQTIVASIRAAHKTKFRRKQTVVNTLQYARLEEVLEATSRRLWRVLSNATNTNTRAIAIANANTNTNTKGTSLDLKYDSAAESTAFSQTSTTAHCSLSAATTSAIEQEHENQQKNENQHNKPRSSKGIPHHDVGCNGNSINININSNRVHAPIIISEPEHGEEHLESLLLLQGDNACGSYTELDNFTLGATTLGETSCTPSVYAIEKFHRELERELFGDVCEYEYENEYGKDCGGGGAGARGMCDGLPSMVGQTFEIPCAFVPSSSNGNSNDGGGVGGGTDDAAAADITTGVHCDGSAQDETFSHYTRPRPAAESTSGSASAPPPFDEWNQSPMFDAPRTHSVRPSFDPTTISGDASDVPSNNIDFAEAVPYMYHHSQHHQQYQNQNQYPPTVPSQPPRNAPIHFSAESERSPLNSGHFTNGYQYQYQYEYQYQYRYNDPYRCDSDSYNHNNNYNRTYDSSLHSSYPCRINQPAYEVYEGMMPLRGGELTYEKEQEQQEQEQHQARISSDNDNERLPFGNSEPLRSGFDSSEGRGSGGHPLLRRRSLDSCLGSTAPVVFVARSRQASRYSPLVVRDAWESPLFEALPRELPCMVPSPPALHKTRSWDSEDDSARSKIAMVRTHHEENGLVVQQQANANATTATKTKTTKTTTYDDCNDKDNDYKDTDHRNQYCFHDHWDPVGQQQRTQPRQHWCRPSGSRRSRSSSRRNDGPRIRHLPLSGHTSATQLVDGRDGTGAFHGNGTVTITETSAR